MTAGRIERSRVLHGGSTQWATPEAAGRLRLDDGRVVDAAAVQYLAPCVPTKILCVHTNYRSRFFELTGKTEMPPTPTYFQKPLSALNYHGGEIILPDGYKFLNYEGELAAIIGRPMRNVRPEEVWDNIAGFAPSNDISLHDMRDADMGSMLRVKGCDGFCPIGPAIVSGQDIRDAVLRTYLNGALVQEGAIADMIFGIDYLIADLARHITLEPGDIVLTGTPANSRPMQDGDVVEVDISGIGRLSNTVRRIPSPQAAVGFQPVDSAEVRRVSLGNNDRLPPHLARSPLTF